ncbi:MAG: T9SS type A sorting domain-containing protein [Bacteroidetes bacterium]|nr:T9SS type A sorting domain-containing protein [Bacteroidota bacterium]
MKHILPVFAFLAVLLAAQSSNAQLWQQTNGVGTDGINSIVVNTQGHLFICGRGLMRSTDAGLTWETLPSGGTIGNLYRLMIQPSGRLLISHRIIGGNTADSIYASDDEGITWTGLAVTGGRIWQGANGVLLFAGDQGYLRSIDDGKTWTPFTLTGVTEPPTQFYSTSGGVLIVIAQYMYRSTDNGISWSKVVNGLPPILSYPLPIIEMQDGSLFLANMFSYRSLCKSTDQGRTWVADSQFINQEIQGIVVDRNGGALMARGLFTWLTTDFGKTWIKETLAPVWGATASEGSRSFLLRDGSTLYRFQPPSAPTVVSGANGMINSLTATRTAKIVAFDIDGQGGGFPAWSSDQGTSWQIVKSHVVSTAAATDSSGDILVGSGGSVLLSADDAQTWNTASPSLTSGLISGIAVRFNGDIFVSSSTEGIFRSTDRGATWDQLTSGMPTQNLYSLAVAPNGDVFVGSNASIYYSTNDGLTWSSLNANLPATAGNVTSLVVNAQGAIIAGVQNAGIYWSTDNGATWNQKATGFTAKNVNTLLATPSGKVFAGTEAGVFFLDTAAGSSWIPYNLGITAPNVLSLCRDNAGRIYAGTDGSGVFRSVQTFNKIIPADAPTITQTIGQITFPRAPLGTTRDTILDGIIASKGSNPLEVYGVRLIADAGQTGDFSIANPLPFPFTVSDGKPLSFTVSAHPQTYGTSHAMLYIYTNAPEAVSTVELVATATDQSLVGAEHNSRSGETCELYPNPAASAFKINLSSSGFGVVDVRVQDCLGRVVLTQHEHVSAEMSTIEVSTASLHDGAYYVEVRTPDGRSVTTPIVIRK